MTDLLPCVEIEPVGEARAAVIWMHGLGADGNDFAPIVNGIVLAGAPGIRLTSGLRPRRAIQVVPMTMMAEPPHVQASGNSSNTA